MPARAEHKPTQQGENMPEQNKAIATASGRACLKCKYLGPTNSHGTRISVQRYESGRGKDPQRIVVSWDYGLEIADNYAQAVQTYLNEANWSGHWVTSTVTDGAVAVYVGAVAQ
jgi:hypothetical protein